MPIEMLTAIGELAGRNQRSFSAQLVSMLEMHPALAHLHRAREEHLRTLLEQEKSMFAAWNKMEQKRPG
jgi:hypothetical protein